MERFHVSGFTFGLWDLVEGSSEDVQVLPQNCYQNINGIPKKLQMNNSCTRTGHSEMGVTYYTDFNPNFARKLREALITQKGLDYYDNVEGIYKDEDDNPIPPPLEDIQSLSNLYAAHHNLAGKESSKRGVVETNTICLSQMGSDNVLWMDPSLSPLTSSSSSPFHSPSTNSLTDVLKEINNNSAACIGEDAEWFCDGLQGAALKYDYNGAMMGNSTSWKPEGIKVNLECLTGMGTGDSCGEAENPKYIGDDCCVKCNRIIYESAIDKRSQEYFNDEEYNNHDKLFKLLDQKVEKFKKHIKFPLKEYYNLNAQAGAELIDPSGLFAPFMQKLQEGKEIQALRIRHQNQMTNFYDGGSKLAEGIKNGILTESATLRAFLNETFPLEVNYGESTAYLNPLNMLNNSACKKASSFRKEVLHGNSEYCSSRVSKETNAKTQALRESGDISNRQGPEWWKSKNIPQKNNEAPCIDYGSCFLGIGKGIKSFYELITPKACSLTDADNQDCYTWNEGDCLGCGECYAINQQKGINTYDKLLNYAGKKGQGAGPTRGCGAMNDGESAEYDILTKIRLQKIPDSFWTGDLGLEFEMDAWKKGDVHWQLSYGVPHYYTPQRLVQQTKDLSSVGKPINAHQYKFQCRRFSGWHDASLIMNILQGVKLVTQFGIDYFTNIFGSCQDILDLDMGAGPFHQGWPVCRLCNGLYDKTKNSNTMFRDDWVNMNKLEKNLDSISATEGVEYNIKTKYDDLLCDNGYLDTCKDMCMPNQCFECVMEYMSNINSISDPNLQLLTDSPDLNSELLSNYLEKQILIKENNAKLQNCIANNCACSGMLPNEIMNLYRYLLEINEPDSYIGDNILNAKSSGTGIKVNDSGEIVPKNGEIYNDLIKNSTWYQYLNNTVKGSCGYCQNCMVLDSYCNNKLDYEYAKIVKEEPRKIFNKMPLYGVAKSDDFLIPRCASSLERVEGRNQELCYMCPGDYFGNRL